MAGVVRRDGLREAVTKLRDEWVKRTDRMPSNARVTPRHLQTRIDELSRVLDAVPDVPPSHLDPEIIGNAEGNRKIRDADRAAARRELARGQVPDVPPDPPAADRSRVIALLGEHFWSALDEETCSCGWLSSNWLSEADVIANEEGSFDECPASEKAFREWRSHVADNLLSSGVLVDAAVVRARALEDAADAFETQQRALTRAGELHLWVKACDYLRDRAVSEREGTSRPPADTDTGRGQ